MKVITTESKPIKLWLDDIEDGALEQAKNLANLPFTYKWVSIMPDSHQGYGMPIGGVLATENVVIPNAVGVDIGCGMSSVQSDLHFSEINSNQIKQIMSDVRKKIPLGFEHHKTNQEWDGFEQAPNIPIVQNQLKAARKQLGTLGGGNHFIEIQKDCKGIVWIMIHSGSRNFGYKIAHEYHKIAQFWCERWYSQLLNKDLAFLPIETPEAKQYLEAMNFALRFAKENRKRMINHVMDSVADITGKSLFNDVIDVHHNYAAWENHFGKNVIVHRKGATSAKFGEIGIVPGSQGTKSYIVEGKGNEDSFCSCSHGAGRKMSRKQAQRELDLEQEKQKLDDLGIIHSIRHKKDLDEASGAYKDISVVMKNQMDLVDILIELQPLAVVKG